MPDAQERACTRGHDRRRGEPEQAVPRPRRHSRDRASLTGELRVIRFGAFRSWKKGMTWRLLVAAANRETALEEGDVVVVAQKAVSKVEGRVVHLDGIEPSDQANELAADEDARRLEVILRESRRIVRARPPLVIAETRHGFVCASAGVDQSNARGLDTLVLLPVDPDASARPP